MKKNSRLTSLMLGMYLLLGLVLGRLFYWQVIKAPSLQAQALSQYERTINIEGSRGSIYTQDGYLLVGNEQVYRLFVEPPLLDQEDQKLVDKILPVLTQELDSFKEATEEAQLDYLEEQLETSLLEKLSQKQDKKWLGLLTKINETAKNKLQQLDIKGLGFDPYEVRFYPEASMAAQLTGFVGKNANGFDTGYFGVEGALNKELQKRSFTRRLDLGWFGLDFLRQTDTEKAINGRDITLSVRRDVQHLLETELDKSLARYGAKSGEVVVMEAKTGKILGAATFPNYDQKKFYEYDQYLYKNPIVADVFEPGSIFKVITMAAGLETGAITPQTKCEICDGPAQIDKYTIKTWNNEYNPDINMTEALAKSDNVAMVYAVQRMDKDEYVDVIERFGIGQKTIDELQEDDKTPFPKKWGPVELATVSFGQGISTNTLQMVRAVGAIANDGWLIQPSLIESVNDPVTHQNIKVEPEIVRQVVSEDTANQVTDMMVNAAEHGEAQWIASKIIKVAGKTGTAQIPVDGEYDPNKTIASFIGFAPADDPEFVMMVKFVEPESSPWAAETAAPTWYSTAHKLTLLLSVPTHTPSP